MSRRRERYTTMFSSKHNPRSRMARESGDIANQKIEDKRKAKLPIFKRILAFLMMILFFGYWLFKKIRGEKKNSPYEE